MANHKLGAIRLALTVARELDRPGHAFAWIKDGSPANVSFQTLYGVLSC